jgi:hypothetical protein
MPAIIDYANQDALSVLFNSAFMDEIKQNLGLDPSTDTADLPLNVESLLAEAISVLEQQQWRFIRRKPVTMQLPYEAFFSLDKLLFLPYGPASSLTTFSFTDTDGASQNVSSSEYTLYAGEPLKLWCDDWQSILPNIDDNLPYPVTITYTTGYSTFAAIPPSTIRALKILTYHMFEYRDLLAIGQASIIPEGYRAHADLDMLNCRRAIRYTAEDYKNVGYA